MKISVLRLINHSKVFHLLMCVCLFGFFVLVKHWFCGGGNTLFVDFNFRNKISSPAKAKTMTGGLRFINLHNITSAAKPMRKTKQQSQWFNVPASHRCGPDSITAVGFWVGMRSAGRTGVSSPATPASPYIKIQKHLELYTNEADLLVCYLYIV